MCNPPPIPSPIIPHTQSPFFALPVTEETEEESFMRSISIPTPRKKIEHRNSPGTYAEQKAAALSEDAYGRTLSQFRETKCCPRDCFGERVTANGFWETRNASYDRKYACICRYRSRGRG